MELYLDEKWKLSEKVSRGSSSSSSRRRSLSSSSSSSSTELRAYLQKRQSSMPTEGRKGMRMRPQMRSFTNLVKEQRARFYIMRRCITMLICWRDYP